MFDVFFWPVVAHFTLLISRIASITSADIANLGSSERFESATIIQFKVIGFIESGKSRLKVKRRPKTKRTQEVSFTTTTEK